MNATPTPLNPVKLGKVAFWLPVITFHVCWLVSMAQGVFEPCFPYWSDCVSISHTGRHELSYFLFKGGIIPTAVLLFLYWRLSRLWLVSMGAPDIRALTTLALIGSFALLAYTLALGHSGDSFRLVRRFGVVLFMFCTFISQVMLANAMTKIAEQSVQLAARKLLRFSAFTLAIAIFSLVLDVVLDAEYDRLEDAFEWWLIMLLLGHLYWTVRLWQSHGFVLTTGTRASP